MLQVAYIAGDGPKKQIRERKLTDKEQLRRNAMVALAARRIQDRESAKKKFAPEQKEIERLTEKRDQLRAELQNLINNDKVSKRQNNVHYR